MTDRQPPSSNDTEWPTPAAHHPRPHGNCDPSPATPPDLGSGQKSDDSAPEPLKTLNPNSLATDGQLVDFLRQHRPSPPPAHPEIEQALLREIQILQTQNTRRSWQWWAGGLGALAIGCVALLSGNNGAQRSAPIIADAELERFIEDTWVITVAPSTLSTTTASADDLLPWSFDPATWDSGPTKIVSNSLSAMVINPQTKPYL